MMKSPSDRAGQIAAHRGARGKISSAEIAGRGDRYLQVRCESVRHHRPEADITALATDPRIGADVDTRLALGIGGRGKTKYGTVSGSKSVSGNANTKNDKAEHRSHRLLLSI